MLLKIDTQKFFLNYFWSMPGCCSLLSMDNLEGLFFFFSPIDRYGIFVIDSRDTD